MRARPLGVGVTGGAASAASSRPPCATTSTSLPANSSSKKNSSSRVQQPRLRLPLPPLGIGCMRGDICRLNADHTWLVELQDDLLAAAPTIIGVLITARPQQVPPPLAIPLPANQTALRVDTWAKPIQLHTLPRTQLVDAPATSPNLSWTRWPPQSVRSSTSQRNACERPAPATSLVLGPGLPPGCRPLVLM